MIDLIKNLVEEIGIDIFALIFILALLSLILLINSIVLAIKSKKRERIFKMVSTANSIYKVLDLENSFEKNLTSILLIFQGMIEASEYSIYTRNLSNQDFALKAVLHKDENQGEFTLVYSGYRKFIKDSIELPTYLPRDTLSHEIEITNKNESKFNNKKSLEMTIPIEGGKAIIKISQITEMQAGAKETIKIMREILKPVIDILLKNESMETELNKLNTSNAIMRNVPSTLMNHTGILKVILGTLIKATMAQGGFIIRRGDLGYTYEASIGWDSNIERIFENDFECHRIIDNIFENEDYIIIDKSHSEYYKLPEYFATLRMDQIFIFRVRTESYEIMVGFWHYGKYKINKEHVSMINMVADGIRQAYSSEKAFEGLKNRNIDILKMICRTIDNLTPFTVGYSNMMSYFSKRLALALGLNKGEAEEIALAAYFSHIGVAVLSNDVHFEKIKYSQEDFETMKIHVDVGAAIVETSLGSKKMADYIRYHHERNDGKGYPTGIKGEEIPLGAKIISVVQFFLAKIRGRKYRAPVSFDEAIQSIKAASGSQIDSYVVNVFVKMLYDMGKDKMFSGKAAFNCWELREAENICGNCSAFGRDDKNCWEFGKRKCELHGSECESCFIYTEFRDRNKRGI